MGVAGVGVGWSHLVIWIYLLKLCCQAPSEDQQCQDPLSGGFIDPNASLPLGQRGEEPRGG